MEIKVNVMKQNQQVPQLPLPDGELVKSVMGAVLALNIDGALYTMNVAEMVAAIRASNASVENPGQIVVADDK